MLPTIPTAENYVGDLQVQPRLRAAAVWGDHSTDRGLGLDDGRACRGMGTLGSLVRVVGHLHCDGTLCGQLFNGDLGTSLCLEGHGGHLGGDSVVADVAKRKGVGVHQEDELHHITEVGQGPAEGLGDREMAARARGVAVTQ